jgi:hypothetical protein
LNTSGGADSLVATRIIRLRQPREEAHMSGSSGLAVITFGFLGLIFLITLLDRRLARIERRMRALARIEARLELLLRHAGLSYDPYPGLPPDVADALRRDAKIEAIKRLREATGISLAEAKARIEKFDL